MRYLIGLVMLATGCGGSDDPGGAECSKSDRSGTYLFAFTEESGNCGAIPDQLNQVEDPEAVPDGCSLDAADKWSASECKLERAYTCDEPGIGPGVTSSSVAVTTQQDSSGAKLTGLLTITVNNPDGTVICKSTYSGTITRQ